MNILFFLKPKAEVAFVYDYHTLRQAMEIMEYHKYSSIPMINREGKYVRFEPIGTGRTGRCAGAYHPAVRTTAERYQQSTGRNTAPPCEDVEL